MESTNHSLASLFDQLGLNSSNEGIENFINSNAPLSDAVDLHKADFWSASQASFLEQAANEDADWAEIVDQLNEMLRSPRT